MLDAEIDDIEIIENSAFLHCPLEELDLTKKFAEEQGLKVVAADPAWIAKNKMNLQDESAIEKVGNFLDKIEDMDDVQEIFTNLE